MTPKTAPSTPPCNPCGLDPHHRTKVVVLEGTAKQALELGRSRLVVAGLAFALAFLIVGVRLVELTSFGQARASNLAERQAIEAPALGRAEIQDRNGRVLATTVPSVSLYADARDVRDPEAVARQLAQEIPSLSFEETRTRLASNRSFVWLKRDITPRQHTAINALGIPGIQFQRESRRVYPHGALTAHAVGFTDIDSRGIAGAERAFDEWLSDGAEPVRLSLDIRIQHILAEELQASIESFNAIGGTGVVLDIDSGEIVSMVSLPSFDPAAPDIAGDDQRFNRASLGIFEMGSVFKIFTTAMALDSGAVALDDAFDVRKPIRINRYTIRDFKPKKRDLTVPEVFVYSSNIGTVQMALAAGTDHQQTFLEQLGLLRQASIELPEVGSPLLPDRWREINTMTISYGHGLAVSPIQLVRAVSAMVNGGELRPVTVLRRQPGELVTGQRVIGEQTSAVVRWLMRMVVQHGTGRKADAEGFLVGGKTGTAEKIVGKRYARNARIASFVAAFPMDRPRYVIFVMVDEPKGKKETFGYATGGWVAAPVVKRAVERMSPLLGVLPRADEETEGADIELIPASAEGFTLAAN